MSEKPRHTSNTSGDNRPMYKGNRTEKSRGKKGGYKGKGFKDNRRDGNGYDRNGASAAAIKNSTEITNQASVPALAGSTVQKTRLKKMCALLEGAQGTGPQKRKPLKLIMMLLGGN